MSTILAISLLATIGFSGESYAAPPVPEVQVRGTVDVSPLATVAYRYIGLTTHQDDGSFAYQGLEGIAAMNKVCADEFGAGAKAATPAEARFRFDTSGGQGWLVPGRAGLQLLETATGEYQVADAESGERIPTLSDSQNLATLRAFCAMYGNDATNISSLVSLPSGGVLSGVCDLPRPVACSALVVIPVGQ